MMGAPSKLSVIRKAAALARAMANFAFELGRGKLLFIVV
jgi:hypothetical protein